MKVPLAAQRVVQGDEQLVEVWADGERRVVPAPMKPYYFCAVDPRSLPHREKVLGWEKEKVRLLSSLDEVVEWWKVTTATVKGVTETAEWEKAGGRFAENHLRFLERILVDQPDWFRQFPNSAPLRTLTFDIEQSVPDDRRMPARANVLCSIAWACDVDGQPPGEIRWAHAEVDTSGRMEDRGLIERFLAAWKEFDPDVASHFNGDAYDLPVLMERMRLHGLDSSALCRRDRPWTKEVGIAGGGFKRTREVVVLPGRLSFDVYDGVRLDQSIYGVKSRGLKDVAEFMGHEVLRLDGAKPQDLLRNDVTGLESYNKSDVRLTRLVGGGYWRNAVALAEQLGVPLGTILHASPSLYTTVLQVPVLRAKGIVSDGQNRERFAYLYADPACPKKDGEPRPVTGATVFCDRPGLYKPVYRADFASLYPSVVVSLGLGADNTRFVCWEDYGPVRAQRFGDVAEFSIPDEGWGRNLRVEVEGRSGFADTVWSLMQTRYRKKAAGKVAMAREGPDSASYKVIKAEENALKVLINASSYGGHAAAHARYGSVVVAMIITGVGRLLLAEARRLVGAAACAGDTDGIYSSQVIDIDTLNRSIDAYARGPLGLSEPVFGMDLDTFDGAYFLKQKNYLLWRRGRVERHGAAFKSSGRPAIHDKVVEDVSATLFREGLSTARSRASRWNDLGCFEARDFVMRVRIGRDEYKHGNPLSAQVAELMRQRDGRAPPIGSQIEYVRTTRGVELADEDGWFRRIDRPYYRGVVAKAIGSLSLETRRQVQFTDYFG